MNYDKAYFIAKFEAIHEREWTVGTYHEAGRSCAAGHCMRRSSPNGELGALVKLFPPQCRGDNFDSGAVRINDGQDDRYQQPTPKQRILAALRDLP